LKDWNENIDALIAADLAGEISASQREELGNWLNLDPANQQYADAMKMIFSSDLLAHTYSEERTNRAWENVKGQLKSGGGRTRNLNWLKYAAAAVVVLAAGIWMFSDQLSGSREMIVVADTGLTKSSLPGGTVVALRKGAEIRFTDDSTSSEQRVTLKGEAFFEVGPAGSGKLVVETAGLKIRDIGTAFNVRALPGEDTVMVFVQDGAVALEVLNHESLVLQKGEEGFYVPATGETGRILTPDPNTASYADLNFKFRNTPLRKAIRKLNEVYGEKFAIANDSISDCRITVTFASEPVDVIAEIMAQTLGLTVVQKDGVYLFDGHSCD
jgi:ferric-dicitrate binding protein FerR (iron transport regulator)